MLGGVKNFVLLILLTSFVTTIPKDGFANPEKSKPRILVVHSYAPDYNSYSDLNRLIESYLKKEKISAEIRTFYLDCEQYNETDETQRMFDYIDSVSQWQPDLILANDDQATYSLLSSRHPLVFKTPIVFTGVNFPNWNLMKKYTEITGSWDKPDYLETVNMIEQLMGKTRIRFFHDNTFLGKQVTRELSEQLEKQYPHLSQRLKDYLKAQQGLSKESPIDILQEDSIPNIDKPDSTTFSFVDIRRKGGRGLLWTMNGMVKYAAFVQTKYDFTSIRVGRMAAIPTFTVINEGFDYNQGVLGGYITTLDIQAKEGVQLVARILRGEKASSIPIRQSQKEHILDWTELQRWKIPSTAIPYNYEVVNIPFYVQHKLALIFSASIFSTLVILLIAYLIYLYSRENRRKRKAQANLLKEKEFLSLSLEGSNIFAWKYEEESDVFSFDKDFFEKLKITPRTFTREQIWSIVHPEVHSAIKNTYQQVKSGQKGKAGLECLCNFNGQGYVWYEFRYIYVPSEKAIIGLILNIQDYKDREKELTDARDLAAKAELKQSFLANMSHEIRTPLNAIVGFANLLTNEELAKEEKEEFIGIINHNCESLLKLIGDILEISRIESDNLAYTLQTFDLNILLEDIYSTHQLMMPPNVRLLKEIPSAPIVIKSDKLRLGQVITNLINNAVKFTSSGHILLGCEINQESQELHLYVQDTGKGIPLQEQRMIFERFYKRDEFAQGTGLGLSICSGIVKKLGGKIRLFSKEGEGSTFTVVLPYAPSSESPSSPQPDNSQARPKQSECGEKGNDKKTILIAEDHESNYRLLKTILQKDYHLIWVTNGRDAIQRVEDSPVDLILMDIKMPEMNGLEALKEIRKKHKNLPIIMQTAYAFDADREEAIQAGCSGFITKPVMSAELFSLIRQTMGKHHTPPIS